MLKTSGVALAAPESTMSDFAVFPHIFLT